jgi:hypothetical protein|uniref:Uncharacterized protein n=1 Tax=Sipha flava TaxID=143950 RepID=A0A2S2RAB9_9HEMI
MFDRRVRRSFLLANRHRLSVNDIDHKQSRLLTGKWNASSAGTTESSSRINSTNVRDHGARQVQERVRRHNVLSASYDSRIGENDVITRTIDRSACTANIFRSVREHNRSERVGYDNGVGDNRVRVSATRCERETDDPSPNRPTGSLRD